MKIGDHEFRRVAILVLDYPNKEKRPSEVVTGAYTLLNKQLRKKYSSPSGLGLYTTVLANKELVARHQKDFEKIGLLFLPDWKNSKEYGDVLKEGLRQGTDIYVMKYVGSKNTDYFLWPVILGQPESEGQLEITDLEGKVDIKPNPNFKHIKPIIVALVDILDADDTE